MQILKNNSPSRKRPASPAKENENVVVRASDEQAGKSKGSTTTSMCRNNNIRKQLFEPRSSSPAARVIERMIGEISHGKYGNVVRDAITPRRGSSSSSSGSSTAAVVVTGKSKSSRQRKANSTSRLFR